MPAPDSTVEEVRAIVLKYIRMYEEGSLTLSDLAAELAVMAPAYDRAMGGVGDHWGGLLAAAFQQQRDSKLNPLSSFDALERALTDFRRTEAAW